MMPSAGTPDLPALELLVTVAETGSLGRAAARHGVSQPAVSLRLRALERRLGLVLLDRAPTGSTLTVAGQAVVDWTRPVLDAAAALARSVAALRDEQRGRLRVAASLTIADHLIPAWLVALHTTLPTAEVSLQVGNSDRVVDLVRRQEVDLGFVEGPDAPSGLRSRVVGGDQLVVVTAPGHRWSRRRRPLSAAELAATPLVLRESGSGTREALAHALAVHGSTPTPAVELGSTTAIRAAVAAGQAPAVLSGLTVADDLATGRLVEVVTDGIDLRRRFRAVWSAGPAPVGPAATLLRIADRQQASRPGRRRSPAAAR